MITVFHAVAVADRYRGYLSSVSVEIAAGLYVAPAMSKAVRERVWETLSSWWSTMPGGSLVMLWRDKDAPGEIALLTLGTRRYEPVEIDGMILMRS